MVTPSDSLLNNSVGVPVLVQFERLSHSRASTRTILLQVGEIPVEDMQTIDELWKAASKGKFGFSVQRQIWRACNEQWSKFFLAIDWLKGENLNYRAWPAEFTYDVDEATKGHLPLTNALRGTQLFQAILQHPAFESKDKLNSWSE